MLLPICISCQRFFRPERNGFRFTEGMPKPSYTFVPVPPGKEAAHMWQPYKLWIADLYKCPGCGTQIVSGFANCAYKEHYMPGFKEAHETMGFDQFQVNDCC